MKIVGVVAIAGVLVSAAALAAPATRSQEPCGEKGGVRLWSSPAAPVAGEPVRILAVAADGKATAAELAVTTGGKARRPLSTVRRGGPPASFSAELSATTTGEHRVELLRDGRPIACRTITIAPRRRPPPRAAGAGVWPTTRAWDAETEAFYAAWIEALFDAPAADALAFPSLAPAIRDPARNFLHDHLGLREDDAKNRSVPRAEPDCADLPYYLRAYFAWKLGLPFGMRDCDRGTSGRPPRCGALITNEKPGDDWMKGPPPKDALGAWKKFLRQLANKVHSGSARTALGDEQTDYYPVALTREALRPGTIYADPYGHILMVVKWIEQAPGGGGRLLAVDGQPDNSVGRKRFWEGTFLFSNDTKSAGPGFKVFRPVERAGDELAQLSNAALANDRRFAPFSTEQGKLTTEAFYARMSKLINPRGLDATGAYEEMLGAVIEQLETRIGSVDTGEKYMRDSSGAVIPMPEGPKIFETVGPWEDYATPSRDMRLIIAMNVLVGLPAQIERHPELFVLGGRKPAEVRAAIEALHARRVRERAIEYRRTDGTPFRLTVADLLARKSGFEIAYNPNDCVEVRWGASGETPDFATCKRRAPADQQARMAQYRTWFRDAKRPPR